MKYSIFYIISLFLIILISNTAQNTYANDITNNESNSFDINWSVPEVISTSSNESSVSANSAFDNSNNQHLVWIDKSNISNAGFDFDIFYKMYNSTTNLWGDIIIISESSNSSSNNPLITIDSNDNIYIFWTDNANFSNSGADKDIFMRIYNSTLASWGEIQLVSIDTPEQNYTPSIILKDNYIHLVWYDKANDYLSGIDDDIKYKKYDILTNSWSSIYVISTESTDPSFSPNIAIDGMNNVHVVWYDYTDYLGEGTDQDIFYKKFNAFTNTWGNTIVLSTESTLASNNAIIQVDNDNNIHVSWVESTDYLDAGTDKDIFYKKYDNKLNVWTSSILISTESDGASTYVSFVLDEYNNIFITWSDNTNFPLSEDVGTDQDIFFKYYNYELGKWGSVFVISTISSGISFSPMIHLDNEYNIIISWTDSSDYLNSDVDYDIFMIRGSLIPFTPDLKRSSKVDSNIVELDWDKMNYAKMYNVYRDSNPIYNISGLTPIATVGKTEYNETLNSSGLYFYAITANNMKSTSEISNIIHVVYGMGNIGKVTETETVTKSNDGIPDISILSQNQIYLIGAGIAFVTLIIFIKLISKKK